MKQYIFKRCTVWLAEDGKSLDTVFWDDRVAPARFDVNDGTRATAVRLGYGDSDEDVRRMHFEHEIGHTFISQEMGKLYSTVLRDVAKGKPLRWTDEKRREEDVVFAFQKYMNTGEITEPLDELDDPLGLVAVFKACYRDGMNGAGEEGKEKQDA